MNETFKKYLINKILYIYFVQYFCIEKNFCGAD